MARAGSFSTLGTTETCFFRSNRKAAGNATLGTTSGISNPGDGGPVGGIRVFVSSGTLRVRIPSLHGTTDFAVIAAGASAHDFLTLGKNRDQMGDELFLRADSGTADGTFEAIM